jgi:hypothetical protein
MPWEKQAPALDPRDVVNYSGNVAAGLRFESSTGQAIALDPQSVTHLFDTLRRHNPLWDGSADEVGATDADRLRQWFAAHVAQPWNLTAIDIESARLHRVLRAEGLALPQIRPFDAVHAVVGHEVIFFDRRHVCLARLSSVRREGESNTDADSPVRFEFDLIPLPGLDWAHGTPFTVGASEDFIRLHRGHFLIAMTNVCVIAAPELIADVRRILTDPQYTPAKRIRPIRDCLERRAADASPSD